MSLFGVFRPGVNANDRRTWTRANKVVRLALGAGDLVLDLDPDWPARVA